LNFKASNQLSNEIQYRTNKRNFNHLEFCTCGWAWRAGALCSTVANTHSCRKASHVQEPLRKFYLTQIKNSKQSSRVQRNLPLGPTILSVQSAPSAPVAGPQGPLNRCLLFHRSLPASPRHHAPTRRPA
jgi:hypothetical protein